MKRTIVLLLMIWAHTASAKEPGGPGQRLLSTIAPRPYRNTRESNVRIFYDIDLGYAAMSATGANAFHQSAFTYGGDLGAKIIVPEAQHDGKRSDP